MSTWEVFKTLLKQASFYRNKLMLFIVIGVIAIVAYFLWQNYHTEAQGRYYGPISEAFPTVAESEITLEKNGQVLIDGKKQNQAIKFYENYDELRVIIFDNPADFISYFKATVHLPEPARESDIRQITYAVRGVGGILNYMPDSKTLIYEAQDISPGATLTIVAQMPKGLITPTLAKRIQIAIAHVTIEGWLYIAIILPGITILFMGFMIYKRRAAGLFMVKKPNCELPALVAPAVSGVIVDGSVGAREIAATLIDLAERGYIFIINQGDQFFFAKRKLGSLEATQGLSMFEKALLSKIFLPTSYKSTIEDVEMRIGRHIFSRKIANFYLGVYNQATTQGYFVQNPAKIHLGYKYTGIVLFFLTFVGFIYQAFTDTGPKYSLIFWVGGLVAASLVIRFAPLMPARTARGNQELQKWLSFREYLAAKNPVPVEDYVQGKFSQYLPYAIVLGAEVDWMKRFGEKPFKQPDWYESKERIITLESFANNLFPLIGYVSENLAKSHDPIID